MQDIMLGFVHHQIMEMLNQYHMHLTSIIGIAAIAKVAGLNHPPITFLSSHNPIAKAAEVVIKLQEFHLTALMHRTNSAAKNSNNYRYSPGLTTMTFSFCSCL